MASDPDTCTPPHGPFTGGAEGKPCSGPAALESGEGPMRTAQPGRAGEAEAPVQREPRPPPRSAGLGLPTNAPAPASADVTLGKLHTGCSVAAPWPAGYGAGCRLGEKGPKFIPVLSSGRAAARIEEPSIPLTKTVTGALATSNETVTQGRSPAALIYGPDIGLASSHKPEK